MKKLQPGKTSISLLTFTQLHPVHMGMVCEIFYALYSSKIDSYQDNSFFMFLTDVWSAGDRWGCRAETAHALRRLKRLPADCALYWNKTIKRTPVNPSFTL